ncbi:MAG: NAD(P)/FAD-dependent oxidoreductase, partial [Acidimicrobiales bacterium]
RLEALADHGIHFVNARITAIDPDRRRVETSAGSYDADFLVVALGATDALGKAARLDGAIHDLYAPEELPAMRSALGGLDTGRLVIPVLGGPYKCPPAPYEAAFLVEEYLRRRGVREHVEIVVTTPLPTTLPAAGEEVSDMVAQALAERGIELRTRHAVEAIDCDAQTVSFAGGATLDYTLALAVPQAAPPSVVAESPLAGDGGWIWPDKETARTSFDGVYAAGDCTAVEALPKAGVFAEAMGTVAARNIVAELTGSEPARYDGSGYCFLEFPERRASALEGNFFAKPTPEVHRAAPDAETYARKEAFEAERLQEWLGA